MSASPTAAGWRVASLSGDSDPRDGRTPPWRLPSYLLLFGLGVSCRMRSFRCTVSIRDRWFMNFWSFNSCFLSEV